MISIIDQHLSKCATLDANTLTPMIFDIAWLFIVGKHGREYIESMRNLYGELKQGFFGLPFNLPGFALRKSIEARGKITKMVKQIIDSDPTARLDPSCCLGALPEVYGPELQQKVLGLLLASSETTNSTLNGLLWNLIKNPSILKKLQNEIRSVDCEPTTVGDFQKFPYLNKVVHETLRLFGVDMITRRAKTTLTYKDKVFPPETNFLVVTGHEHQQISNPLEFNPDREEKYKWEPFGTSVRNCLGKNFAQMEIKMIIYRVLKHYDVKPETDADASVYSGLAIRLHNARLVLSPSA